MVLGGQAYLDSEKYEEIALKETWKSKCFIGLIYACGVSMGILNKNNYEN